MNSPPHWILRMFVVFFVTLGATPLGCILGAVLPQSSAALLMFVPPVLTFIGFGVWTAAALLVHGARLLRGQPLDAPGEVAVESGWAADVVQYPPGTWAIPLGLPVAGVCFGAVFGVFSGAILWSAVVLGVFGAGWGVLLWALARWRLLPWPG